jgi:hypothetical protein
MSIFYSLGIAAGILVGNVVGARFILRHSWRGAVAQGFIACGLVVAFCAYVPADGPMAAFDATLSAARAILASGLKIASNVLSLV